MLSSLISSFKLKLMFIWSHLWTVTGAANNNLYLQENEPSLSSDLHLWPYITNWIHANMVDPSKRQGKGWGRRQRLSPSSTCATLFTKWQSSAFIKDGFITRGCITITGRDWVCWLIPACLPPHADIHQPDATSVINYLQTRLLAPDKCVLQMWRCVRAACRWRFVAPFAIINGGKLHRPMSEDACPMLFGSRVSRGWWAGKS